MSTLGKVPKLPKSAFKPNHCAESNRVFLWTNSPNPPFMVPVKGWKIVGYGTPPWKKDSVPLGVLFERIIPKSCEYGNIQGDEMDEGTRIWQHGCAEWVPGRPEYERRMKLENNK